MAILARVPLDFTGMRDYFKTAFGELDEKMSLVEKLHARKRIILMLYGLVRTNSTISSE